MKVLMICGFFAQNNEEEVIAQARSAVEFSANQFQSKLIGGFRKMGCDLQVLSAPFIGAFPTASRSVSFRGFKEPSEEIDYVAFNNIWGFRNFSRSRALKKKLLSFAKDPCPEKMIVIYCPHTPFLEAAAYAKKLDKRIRICFYVPDLPNYMNLNSNRSVIYDAAKYVDNVRMRGYMKVVDSYVLLTAPMKSALPVGEKPFLVAEGIIDGESANWDRPDSVCGSEKHIVYTGKLNEKFGVKDLIDAFALVQGDDYRLVLCGHGDCADYARAAAKQDNRIIVTGQLSPAQALEWQMKASVLVNPRPNNEDYTKYSFPSKIIEYLKTGIPVVAYVLDGMPEFYRDFFWAVDEDKPCSVAICEAILRALSSTAGERMEKNERFVRYARENLCAEEIAQKMIAMTMPGNPG